jgi:hypothetical protein
MDLIEGAATARFSQKVLRQARKRVGRGAFSTFVRIVLDVATGRFAGYSVDAVTGKPDAEEPRILATGLGLTPSRTSRATNAARWLNGEIAPHLSNLSRLLREYSPVHQLTVAEDADLTKARDELRTVLSFVDSFSCIVDRMIGRGGLGISALGKAIREMEPSTQALLLLFWMAFRSGGLGANMDKIISVAQQWQPLEGASRTAAQTDS